MAVKLMNLMVLLVLFFSLASTTQAQPRVTFDVTTPRYGEKNIYDITDSIAQAWSDSCSSAWPSKLVVPFGTYYLRGATFKGPCKAPIDVIIQGRLLAPQDGHQLVNSDHWVAFQDIDRLYISGGRSFEGAYSRNNYRMINVRFDEISNSWVEDITSLDSTNFHMIVYKSHDVTLRRLTIATPGDSPNTDGIHISKSARVNVTNTNINTRDDCVLIGDGAENVMVINVTCGPGHGISIGSLGKCPDEYKVDGIVVRNCTFTNTTNGVRIKTWPRSLGIGDASWASHIYFEDLIMNNVQNPITIDQNYCPGRSCDGRAHPSKVKISNVGFKNIWGTSASKVAVTLECSQSSPYENVELRDINLVYDGDESPDNGESISSICWNVANPTFINVKDGLACRPYCHSSPNLANSFSIWVAAKLSGQLQEQLECCGTL